MGGKSRRDKVRSAIERKREIKKENRLGRERERERDTIWKTKVMMQIFMKEDDKRYSRERGC